MPTMIEPCMGLSKREFLFIFIWPIYLNTVFLFILIWPIYLNADLLFISSSGNGKMFGPDFAEKGWRKAQVVRTGQDPIGEAECHERQAELKLLDLTREAAEAEKVARAAEAAAAAAEAQDQAAAAAPEAAAAAEAEDEAAAGNPAGL
jgi:hypothetical protein